MLLFRHNPRGFRVILVLLLTLALSAVSIASAQSTALTQIAKTPDGQLSARLPQAWLTGNTTSSIYSTALVFGDTDAGLAAALSSVNASQTTVIPGMYGAIGIVAPGVIGTV